MKQWAVVTEIHTDLGQSIQRKSLNMIVFIDTDIF